MMNITDTALAAAGMRALATQKHPWIVDDPFAEALAGVRGVHLAKELFSGNEGATVTTAVRTATIDEMILESVDSVDVVLNLGAGLDSRPFRLPLPKRLVWVDTDLPSVLTHKAERLRNAAPNCFYDSFPLDVFDKGKRETVFRELSNGGKRVLVLAEGLLVYLNPAAVKSLAEDLLCFNLLLTQVMLPRFGLFACSEFGAVQKKANAEFKFMPVNGPEFFLPEWEVEDYRSGPREAYRLAGERESTLDILPPNSDFERKYEHFGTVLLRNKEKLNG